MKFFSKTSLSFWPRGLKVRTYPFQGYNVEFKSHRGHLDVHSNSFNLKVYFGNTKVKFNTSRIADMVLMASTFAFQANGTGSNPVVRLKLNMI